MKFNYTDMEISVDQQKHRALSEARNQFSREMLKRFYEVSGDIEDIWDLASNKSALVVRLRNLAGTIGVAEVDESTMIDIGLIAMVLWNGGCE